MNEPRPARPPKRDVDGWLVLDKPVGLTSTQAVGLAKRVFSAKKAGHAGTLDPLASGLLPIAFGEATKTVPFVMDGHKVYRFTVRWGVETTTDDTEGPPTATSDRRPDRAAIEALLPRYTGVVTQVPPQFSAIKIGGERAYDMARDGETFEIAAREVTITALRLTVTTADTATFEAECGKGTYVRALARDFGRDLGCYGHVVELRRAEVGPFAEEDAVTVEELERLAAGEGLADALLPVDAGLVDIPRLTLSGHDATRLRNGQGVILRGRDAPIFEGQAAAFAGGELVALVEYQAGEILPKRIFHLAKG